ncbi:hypothetical protein, partial [Acinetobacter baumannii]|uniref:hypothetical protein n=1 Tax=Acinetobacter baumannii TaxID=470 RepID=UPI001BC87F6E
KKHKSDAKTGFQTERSEQKSFMSEANSELLLLLPLLFSQIHEELTENCPLNRAKARFNRV